MGGLTAGAQTPKPRGWGEAARSALLPLSHCLGPLRDSGQSPGTGAKMPQGALRRARQPSCQLLPPAEPPWCRARCSQVALLLGAAAQHAVGNQPGNAGLQKGAPLFGEEGAPRTHHRPRGLQLLADHHHSCRNAPQCCVGPPGSCPCAPAGSPLELLCPSPGTAPFPGIPSAAQQCSMTGCVPTAWVPQGRALPGVGQQRRGTFALLRCASTHSPSPEPAGFAFAAPGARHRELQPGFSPGPRPRQRCHGSREVPRLPFLQASPAQPPVWAPSSNHCSELLERRFQLPLPHSKSLFQRSLTKHLKPSGSPVCL